ncbi:kinase-like protein [Melanomma pulvis-pyrius CBS 109.77]|uniref:Kinase-like protein n=1 Tax=Melanomma pulvis-pyrius CBS 109.77 TaxID=1314802 RepID=A0A6A6XBV6_9PLEO|nr:kinase-like protein [Melanomma pulvis-pyrius CBS 109.77]
MSLYRFPLLDDVENVELYRPGGYHPVNLNDVIGSRYKIIHKLGNGGFATIWLAKVLDEDRYVALKILMASVSASDEELPTLNKLQSQGANHPNIVHLQDFFTIEGPNGSHKCLVLDVVGPSLRQLRKHFFSNAMICNYIRQLAEGVTYMHSMGVCHGDLTDTNVLFELSNFNSWTITQVYQRLGQPRREKIRLRKGSSPGPSAPRKIVEAVQYDNVDEEWLSGGIRIADFGVCFLADCPPERLPTPVSFTAPEVFFQQKASTGSDVWALGCLIFQLRTSHLLFPAFFGQPGEAVGRIVQTLGSLPKDWQHRFVNCDLGDDHWFFNENKREFSLESQISKVEPKLTSDEAADFLSLLRGIFTYESDKRLSAQQIATHFGASRSEPSAEGLFKNGSDYEEPQPPL